MAGEGDLGGNGDINILFEIAEVGGQLIPGAPIPAGLLDQIKSTASSVVTITSTSMRDALAKAITANLDFNGDNQVVGVEILNLSKRVSKPDLSEFQFQSA